MARRAHGSAERIHGGVDALLAAAQDPRVRVIALASPNDPTGELLPAGELARLLAGLPEGVAVLLDEALVEFSDAQEHRASLQLLEHHPRLLVFRTFSKAWGLAGLRIGYAIGAPESEELLAELDPDLGVSELSQAGALEALHSCTELVERRTRELCRGPPAAHRRAARARIRAHRQPGELRVGGAPRPRWQRARRPSGAQRGARRERRRAGRAAPRSDHVAAARERAAADRCDRESASAG